jgi:uncharacterized membrane protein
MLGFVCLILGGWLLVISIISIIICQYTKGGLFDLNPIVPVMFVVGLLLFYVGFSDIGFCKSDCPECSKTQPGKFCSECGKRR